MTRRPASGVEPVIGGRIALFAVAMILVYAGLGIAIVYASVKKFRMLLAPDCPRVAHPGFQFVLWGAIIVLGFIIIAIGPVMPGLIAVLAAQALPLAGRKPRAA